MIERYEAIQKVLEYVGGKDLVLSTTGMISRELFTIRDRPGNFYMIGSMGLVSSLGLGVSLMCPGTRVFVIEGDGSALMSLGTLALIAAERPANLLHIILDNEAYESTGAQPSISSEVDLAEVGKSCGYQHVVRADEIEGLEGGGGADVKISGNPFGIVPGEPMVVGRSTHFSYHDHGMDWEISAKNGFYSSFTYQGP